jgi:hypothetical protein
VISFFLILTVQNGIMLIKIKDKIFIYALVDPVEYNENHIYIGKSNNPYRRYGEHINDMKMTSKVNWIKSLLSKGFKPDLVVLEQCENVESVWKNREKYFIKFYRSKTYYTVVNATNGGEGGGNVATDNVRFNVYMSKSMKKDLVDLSDNECVNASSVVRDLIENYLKWRSSVAVG